MLQTNHFNNALRLPIVGAMYYLSLSLVVEASSFDSGVGEKKADLL